MVNVFFESLILYIVVVQQVSNILMLVWPNVLWATEAVNCESVISQHPASVTYYPSYSHQPALCWFPDWTIFVRKSRHGQQYNQSVEVLPHNQLNLSYWFGLNFLRKPLLGFSLPSFKSGVGLVEVSAPGT